MKNKIALLALALFIAVNFCSAQVSVGRSFIGPFKDFRKGEYELIKSKTTVFVVAGFDIKEFEEVAKKVWTLNPYIVISEAEYAAHNSDYINEKYAIWQVQGFIRSVTSSKGFTTEYLYVYYRYFYPTDIKEKKGKLKYDENEIASVFLSGNTDAAWEMISSKNFGNLQQDLYNYQLGYVKNYLQCVNDLLADGGFSFVYDTDYDKKKVKALAKATLYVPDYFKSMSKWGWRDEEREKPEELFEKYPYKYEFIDNNELSEKILNASEDFYYVSYTRVNGQKLITVTNGKTGDIFYRDYQTFSYKVKSKDIAEIAKAIKK